MSYSVKSISRLIRVSCAISRNQSKLIKQVMCPNGVPCVKPMTHNYESCAKDINHMTRMVRHVNYQPITINEWHAIASSCQILLVNWYHNVKDNEPMTNNYSSCESLPCLVTVCASDTYWRLLHPDSPFALCGLSAPDAVGPPGTKDHFCRYTRSGVTNEQSISGDPARGLCLSIQTRSTSWVWLSP